MAATKGAATTANGSVRYLSQIGSSCTRTCVSSSTRVPPIIEMGAPLGGTPVLVPDEEPGAPGSAEPPGKLGADWPGIRIEAPTPVSTIGVRSTSRLWFP